ncbi:hypothetical protein PI124_g17397 [Phytophthora idaei]|nr:hypothetical protein PI125_g17961 [Phytophthora idaei]KAG3138924.1 hypothetical protein PI126_g16703 [Phytophthora idaei]KAG3237617.1 hypothetical protein PI124_g17397 [Phytophthora idaei]
MTGKESHAGAEDLFYLPSLAFVDKFENGKDATQDAEK